MRTQRSVLMVLVTVSMIVLAACAPSPSAGLPPWAAPPAEQTSTQPPVEATASEPVAPAPATAELIPTTTPVTLTVEVAAATPAPITSAPTAASPAVTETQVITATLPSVVEMATYRDDEAGFEIDYPLTWSIVDVAPEVKRQSEGYSITLTSWQPQGAGSEGIPEGGSKIDIGVTRDGAASATEAADSRRQEVTSGDPNSQITLEEPWELAGGVAATRWTIKPANGEAVYELVTAINGSRVTVSGLGDPDLFEQIAVTLAPVSMDVRAVGGAAAKQAEEAPAASAAGAAAADAEAEAATESLAATVYIVRQGDTLAKIGARFGVTVNALLQANPQITNPDRIYVGQRINIPSAGTNPPPGTQRINIYMIGLGGGSTGCGDQVVTVRRDIPKTPAVLTAALNLLLAQKSQYYGESGLYNALYQSNLRIASISRSGTAWTIRLSGSLVLGGVCDNPRVKAQLERTALQFSTVKSVRYFVNGKSLESLLSGQ